MRQALVLCVVAGLFALLWWMSGSPGNAKDPPPSAEPMATEPATVSATDAADSARTRLDAPAARDALSAPAPTRQRGGLRVHVVLGNAAAPLAHVAVTVHARDGRVRSASEQTAVTDGEGNASFVGLDVGWWHVRLDRHSEGEVEILAATTAEITLSVQAMGEARVRVLDPRGQCVAGAEILLWGASGFLDVPSHEPGRVVGTTGVNGELSLRGLPHLAGHGCWVAARHDLHGVSIAKMVRAPANDGDREVRAIELTLGAGGACLDVRVLDPRGQPVVGAKVRARPLDHPGSVVLPAGRELPHVMRHGSSDAYGRVALTPLAAGEYRLGVTATGFASTHQVVRVSGSGRSPLEVRLADEARVGGRVTDRTGRALAGVEVQVQIEPHGATVTTGLDGTLALDGLPAGDAVWLARHPNYHEAEGRLSLAAGTASTLTIELSPLPQLHGQLVDASGRALSGWSLEATAPLPGRSDQRRTTTAVDGAFAVAARDDLAYRLDVRMPGQALPLPIDGLDAVRARDEPWHIVVHDEVLPTCWIEGELVDANQQPALAGRVLSVATERLTVVPPCETDVNTGGFRVGPLPPGTYRLTFASLQAAELHRDGIVLQPRGTAHLGRVVVPASGILEVQITLAPGVEPSRITVELESEHGTDLVPVDPGSLTARHPLTPGRYRVTVFGVGFRWIVDTIDITADQSTRLSPLLRPAVRFGLRLHMPAGELGASFVIRDSQGVIAFAADLDDGVASEDWWPFLDPGRYRVEVQGASGTRYAAEFSVDNLERRTAPLDLRVVK